MSAPVAHFAPTPTAARAALERVDPRAYARTRNALDGAVTGLSPYLTHGLLELRDVAGAVAERHDLDVQHKLVFELGWRAYYRHVWAHRGDGILKALHEGVLPEAAYRRDLPTDIARGTTGVPVIDRAVRKLGSTGYLHNHARMWLASYVVHLRKVHWRVGADWMFGLLLDGDLASNHLSWQWIAGTGSHKPYLFNAENVARYAPPTWHCPGTVLDATYAQLDALARDADWVAPAGATSPDATDDAETQLLAQPPLPADQPEPTAARFADRAVWLIHPWALGEVPAEHVPVAWLPAEFFAQWRWSKVRWDFVLTRLAELDAPVCIGDCAELTELLAGAQVVRTRTDPHIASILPANVEARRVQPLFPVVDTRCDSFSRWWRRATKGCHRVHDLLTPTLL